jgi:hypothetical protein
MYSDGELQSIIEVVRMGGNLRDDPVPDACQVRARA